MDSSSPCPSCGRDAAAEHVFCGGCGTQLRRTDQVPTVLRARDEEEGLERCASCNAPLDPAVAFCTGCGAPRRVTDGGAMSVPADDLKERLERATEGEYQILAPLGRGGMGTVFLALDQSLHRHVAIKVMAPALIQDATMQERFRTEARIVATLRHPGIINIHGFRVVDDLYFFVMDYVEGATLRSLIRAHGALPVDLVQAVLYDVGSALQHAHSRSGGVIHRDVKPSNIILEPRGHAIVMDFGISKAANARSGLTMTGMVVGTPEYMSPEQCRGGQITAASDQYSLGLVGYAMLTGAPPFTGQHWSVLSKHTTEEPTPVRELRPDCPPEVADAIERMLSKSVKDRWPDILTAVKALGGKPLEDASATRLQIGVLVDGVSAGRRATTPVVAVEIDGLPETAETGQVVSITVTPLDGVGRALEDRAYVIESTDPSVLAVVGRNTLKAVREGSAAVLARCESVEVTRPLKVTPLPVRAVSIAPLGAPVRCGDTLSLEASVLDASGARLEGKRVVWASSDPSVAVVSRSGELKALSAGPATIFATSEGQSTTLDLEVLPAVEGPAPARDGPAATVVLPASELHGAAEPPPVLTRPEPSSGRRSAPFLWLTGAVAAAAVVFWIVPLFQASGPPAGPDLLPGPPPGPQAAVVEVTLNGEEAPGTIDLLVGETVDLEAAPMDDGGQSVAVAVQWSSSDGEIVAVNRNGLLSANQSGSATITVVAGGAERRITARVTEPPPAPAPADGARARPEVASVAIRLADTRQLVGSSLQLEAGTSLPLAADALSAAGGTISGLQVEWFTSNPAIAAVNRAGVLRAIAAGDVSISARVDGVAEDFAIRVVTASPGTLALTVQPYASLVSIDGVRRGEEVRNLELPLAAGPHDLRLEHPTMSTFDTTIVIRSNEVTTVYKVLTPGGGG